MIDVYITVPAIGRRLEGGYFAKDYHEQIARAGRWAEAGNCRGALIFTDHYSPDPWSIAQHLIERTETLIPLVATQPPYMHPYALARIISSFACVYRRQVDINLVTGGNRDHLAAVGSHIEHDERYRRLVEFAKAIGALLGSTEPVTMNGTYYQLNSAYLHPPLRPDMFPRFFAGGSSAALRDAVRTLGITRLHYPGPLGDYPPGSTELQGTGIRVGIIARDTSAEAWRLAEQRFPVNKAGERRRELMVPVIDSSWWHRLGEEARKPQLAESPYWVYPLRGYAEYCPYLVGDHRTVAEYFAGYLDLGISTLILHSPPDEADVPHAMMMLEQAERLRSAAKPAHAAD